MSHFVDIHTHHPTGRHTELRTAGIHPWHAAEHSVAELLPLDEQVQAIGEIGLDALRGADREVQRTLFREQLQLAVEHGLPVVLHCVRSFEEVMRELKKIRPRAVIFHGFTGSVEQMQRAVGQGFHLSFGVRNLRSARTVEALRATPADRLFLESDDDPTPIEELYAKVAAIRGVSIEELCRSTWVNYSNIFETNDR